jgi:hypothetical protein
MQDVHRLRGIARALTPLERCLLSLALQEHLQAETKPSEPTTTPEG